MTNEKRAFVRFAFPLETNIQVTMVPVQGKDAEVSARLLNISQGGLGLAAVKSNDYVVEEEIEMVLQGITGEERLKCLKGQIVKVKWILNSEIFDNLGVGCEFVGLNQECFELIGRICNSH